MTENNEGDWGGEGLPLVIREHIREVEAAVQELLGSIARMRSAVAGYVAGERAELSARH